MRLSISVSSSSYAWWLLAISCLLTIAHMVLSYLTYAVTEQHWLLLQMFDLDDENNLPTWFSCFLLLNASALSLERGQTSKLSSNAWRILGVGFLLLSLDEVAGIHETINTIIEISWVVPASILVLLIGVLFLPFLLRLDPRVRNMLLLAGSIYLGGALGVEFLAADMDEESLVYEFAVSLEEFLEMFGIWLFIWLLLKEKQGFR